MLRSSRLALTCCGLIGATLAGAATAPLYAPSLDSTSLAAPAVGLLLGFADEAGLWITVSGDSVQSRALGALVVPRSTGLWVLGSRGASQPVTNATCDVSAVHLAAVSSGGAREDLWAEPVTSARARPDGSPRHPCGTADPDGRRLRITFVGTDHVSLDERSIGLDREKRYDRFWDSGSTLVASLDALADARGYVPDVDEQTQREWFSACRVDGADELSKLRLASSWGIIREPGRWRLVRRYGYEFDAGLAFYECQIDHRLPVEVVGHDSLAVPIDVIQRAMPTASDAFSSPGRELVVVVDRSRLHIFRAAAGRLGAKLGEVTLSSGELPVLIQWATNAQVDRWTRELDGGG